MISKVSRISSIIILAVILLSSIVVESGSSNVSAAGTDFKISVSDEITVNIDNPVDVENAYGALIKKVGISVSSNSGYTATMKTATSNTNLVEVNNSSLFLTMTAHNYNIATTDMDDLWGFSIVDRGAAMPTYYDGIAPASEEIGTYILGSSTAATIERDMYFAAKPTASTSAGTYSNSVVVTVIAGCTDMCLTNASSPSNTSNTSSIASVNRVLNVATDTGDDEPTTTSKSSVSVNTTNNSQYDSYSDPLGETSTSVNEGTPLATGLAVTAGVAATTGIVLFAIAKRKEDDEDY